VQMSPIQRILWPQQRDRLLDLAAWFALSRLHQYTSPCRYTDERCRTDLWYSDQAQSLASYVEESEVCNCWRLLTIFDQ
jgi:hypothetical protein